MPTIYRNWSLNHVAEAGATDSELGKATLKLLVNVYEILEGWKDENVHRWRMEIFSILIRHPHPNPPDIRSPSYPPGALATNVQLGSARYRFLREGKRSEWAQILRRLEVGGGKDSLSFYFENKQYIRDYRVIPELTGWFFLDTLDFHRLERYGQQLLDLTWTDPNIHGGTPRGGRMS
ncbi:hypothetical protein L218DRAFT_951453 [Marasmius fiardii PR-910]|nr:hypothetical protein L218DRAFT_951453 [Marasmius fiardii PR-910]